MPTSPITGVPGIKTARTSTPRKIVLADPKYLPGGVIIDGSKSRDPLNTGDVDVLRPGMVLGKITATGKYAPSILGVLTAAYTSVSTSETSLQVSAATAVEIARRIGTSGTFKLTGPATAAGSIVSTTITFGAVDTSTGVITVTDPNVNAVNGSFIQPTDGSEAPLCLIPDEVREGHGVKVTDPDGASIDTELANPLIGGVIDASQIINYPADAALITWLKGKLNGGDGVEANTGPFTYDDRF